MNRVLIIGGAREAWDLAQALPGAQVHLPVPERIARHWGRPVTQGDLTERQLDGVSAVIEAAHPWDAETAAQVAGMCRACRVPHLQLVRPAWRASPRRDRWVHLRDARGARQVLPAGARVFVSAGRQAEPALKGIPATFLLRRIGPPRRRSPLRQGHDLSAQGPFSAAEEIATFRRLRIDWLLVHNAGGAGGWPKLAAARALRLPVAMIDRPRRPLGPRVDSVTEALAWLNRRHLHDGHDPE